MAKTFFSNNFGPLSFRLIFPWVLLVSFLVFILFGFGYFIGRYEQIGLNKKLLAVIPDVNCGSKP